jgi:peptidoglycan/xylan/chitin deacetylase (PgdA/CDA1 family)
MLISINYHYIRQSFDSRYPSIHGLTPVQFRTQIEMLARACSFVSAADIRNALRGLKPLPENALAVTFDDGLSEQHELAWPILRQMGVPAIFFINTGALARHRVLGVHKIHLLRAEVPPAELLPMLQSQAVAREIKFVSQIDADKALAHYNYDTPETASLKYLLNLTLSPQDRDALVEACFEEVFARREPELCRELYMSKDQIRELAAADCLGSHTHDHLPVGLLTDQAAEEQIKLSLECLEEWTGARPYAMSYPYGSREACTPRVAELAARHGVEFAFTVERAGNRDLRLPLLLARCDCNDLPGGKSMQWSLEDLFSDIPLPNWYNN